jgi:hypothetical protein
VTAAIAGSIQHPYHCTNCKRLVCTTAGSCIALIYIAQIRITSCPSCDTCIATIWPNIASQLHFTAEYARDGSIGTVACKRLMGLAVVTTVVT